MKNSLRELRDRLGLSRPEMGALLNVGATTIEKYESGPPQDMAERCQAIAAEHGWRDLVLDFADMAGTGTPAVNGTDFHDMSPYEKELCSAVLQITRNPMLPSDKGLPQLILDLMDLRRRRKDEN